MNYITSESEDMTSLKDQVDLSSFEDTNSSQRSGGAKNSLNKGPWTSVEDAILVKCVRRYGEAKWNTVHNKLGLACYGKSCRLRRANHLKPNLKKGGFTSDEESLIIKLHSTFGSKWAQMATDLHGRTDNDIKNKWNTLIKRCQRAGLPLYPTDLLLQTINESMQVQANNEFNSQRSLHLNFQATGWRILCNQLYSTLARLSILYLSLVQTLSNSVLSDYSSPRNGGLLHVVLHEAKIPKSTRNQSTESSPSSYVGTPSDIIDSSDVSLVELEWDEFNEPILPLHRFATSISIKRYHVNRACSSEEQQTPKSLTGYYVGLKLVEQVTTSEGIKEILAEKNNTNALPDMDWFELVECFNDQSSIMDDL